VTGHADRTGNAAANLQLANRRAVAVRNELVHLGVGAQRIKLVPPVALTSGNDDQARRVDVVVAQ
jgi:outer membrane protein OmpA-like peptidoglycan-associated protein